MDNVRETLLLEEQVARFREEQKCADQRKRQNQLQLQEDYENQLRLKKKQQAVSWLSNYASSFNRFMDYLNYLLIYRDVVSSLSSLSGRTPWLVLFRYKLICPRICQTFGFLVRFYIFLLSRGQTLTDICTIKPPTRVYIHLSSAPSISKHPQTLALVIGQIAGWSTRYINTHKILAIFLPPPSSNIVKSMPMNVSWRRSLFRTNQVTLVLQASSFIHKRDNRSTKAIFHTNTQLEPAIKTSLSC